MSLQSLSDPTRGGQGTRFLTGSHKAAYVRPEELSTLDNAAFDTYECPAGSCGLLRLPPAVRKTPSWPRSWANLHILGQPNIFLDAGRSSSRRRSVTPRTPGPMR